MSHIHYVRRLVRILVGFAGALVALGVAAPAAFARVAPQPEGPVTAAPAASAPVAPPPVGPVTRFGPFTPYHPPATAPSHAAAVGMAGWQIALIAVGAALAAAIVAAIVAVLVDRTRSARRLQAATAS